MTHSDPNPTSIDQPGTAPAVAPPRWPGRKPAVPASLAIVHG